jgi:hypothetical protein
VHDGYSLNLAEGRDGRLLVTCWAGCSAAVVLEELRRLELGGWPADEAEDRREDDARGTLWARRLWERAREACRSPVEAYLRCRGITICAPPSLRWAPHCKHPIAGFLSAMIARVDNVDGELVAVHRTYLAKVEPKKMALGRPAGGAVHLASLDAHRALIVGEGIESVLSLMQLRSLPGWAALGTSGLRSLILPRMTTRVLIAVDHDSNGAGEAAARDAGQRWLLENREVRLAMPTGLGDWNDVLRGKCDG